MVDDRSKAEGRAALIEMLSHVLDVPIGPGLTQPSPAEIAEALLTRLPSWLLLRRGQLRDGHIAGAVAGLRDIAHLLERMHASSAIGRSGPKTRRD